MAKKNETNIEVKNEQDSYSMRERINNNKAIKTAEEEINRQKQIEEHEKLRKSTVKHYALRCVADVAVFVSLFFAMKKDLIAPTLVMPATYLCALHIGWCWSKVVLFTRKGRSK